MKCSLLSLFFFIAYSTMVTGQTLQQLRDSAASLPPMPRGSADMINFVQGIPTFASGGPFNDLDFTVFDTDYMDGENSGADVFMPVDPSVSRPGTNKVKYIRCILNTDLNEAYGSADKDRIILGTYEIPQPFFLRGLNGIDDDYAVIHHLDFEAGYIQLNGQASDYRLIYCSPSHGCQTEGWYLYYTAGNQIDLIAFIFPCWDIEPSVSGNPPNNLNPICNIDSTLRLNDTNQFKFANPIDTSVALTSGISQFGSNGKEVVGGMTVDSKGNTYIFGLTDGRINGGSNNYENQIFVIKLNSLGEQVWLWELPMAEGSILKDGVADESYLYVCGRTLGALPGFSNSGKWDGILVKLNLETGDLVASDQWGNPGIDGYGNITLDNNDNLFVSAQGSPAGGGGTDDLYLVAKHKRSDLSNVWRELNPPNATGFIASAEAWGGLSFIPSGPPGEGRLIAGGWYFSSTGANAFISVYEDLNSSNPTRPHSKILTAPGVRADWILDNAADSKGNIYAVGYTTGNLSAPPIGEGDAFVLKYNSDLSNPRIYQFGTPKGDVIRKVSIIKDTIYAIGYTYGNLYAANADPGKSTGDIFILKMDSALNVIQGKQFGTPHEDRAYLNTLDSFLIVAGMTEGYMTEQTKGSFDGFLTILKSKNLEFTQMPVYSGFTNLPHERFSIYPNPVSTELIIHFTNRSSKNRRIIIYDHLGRSLTTKSSTEMNEKINVSSLPSGMYIVKVRSEGEISFRQFFKK